MIHLSELARPRRRWFRISLRGLMILILVVGGLLVWPITIIHSQRQAITAVRAAGGGFWWDYEVDPSTPAGQIPNNPPEPHAPRWVRNVMGDELFQNARNIFLTDLRSTEVFAMLPRFGQVRGMILKGPAAPGPGFNVFRDLPQLEYLEADGPWVTDALLGELSQAPALIQLTVASPAMTAVGVERLASLTRLQNLTITLNPVVTDAGLARAVAGMPRLHQLYVRGQGQPLPATLAALGRHCRDLQSLQLEGTGLVDADLQPLGQLSKLNMLTLYHAPITGAGLVHLGGLKNLAYLYLNETKVADADLVHLNGLTSLVRLDCTATRVGNASLPALASLPNLRFLNLIGTCVTDAGLPALASCPILGDLALGSNGAITDAALPVLATFPKLETVMLDHTRVTDLGAEKLRMQRPKLTIFNTNQGAPPPGATPWQPEGGQP